MELGQRAVSLEQSEGGSKDSRGERTAMARVDTWSHDALACRMDLMQDRANFPKGRGDQALYQEDRVLWLRM